MNLESRLLLFPISHPFLSKINHFNSYCCTLVWFCIIQKACKLSINHRLRFMQDASLQHVNFLQLFFRYLRGLKNACRPIKMRISDCNDFEVVCNSPKWNQPSLIFAIWSMVNLKSSSDVTKYLNSLVSANCNAASVCFWY